MTNLDFFLSTIKSYNKINALVFADQEYTYSWLYQRVLFFQQKLLAKGIKNKIVAFKSNYSADTVALFLSLLSFTNIAVPLSNDSEHNQSICIDVARVQFIIELTDRDELHIISMPNKVDNEILNNFISLGNGGLVLFSSGTTGLPKAILHDCEKLIAKYKKKSRPFITISFLLMDHIGGINTILGQLASGGTIILTNDKSASHICYLVEKYKVTLLPVTPTFLNLLLVAENYKKYDLSSLEVISYGTEVMPEMTLNRVFNLFPKVVLKQTYGLTELGILPSKSESSMSKWVKLGGSEEYQTKIIDNQLWVKTNFSMVGYLNAKSPFDQDGWLNTEDIVETKGEYFRILGRKSDIINVGGIKVFPQEVESVILSLDEIEDAIVSGENHAIMGNIVVATIKPKKPNLNAIELRNIIRQKCKDKLSKHKMPVKIYLSSQDLYNNRFKKKR